MSPSVPVLALLLAAQGPAPGAADAVVTSLTVFAGTPGGLFWTKDWGASWEPAAARPSGASLAELRDVRALLPVGPLVYAGGRGGGYLSHDFGLTWTRFAEQEQVLAILPSRYPQADPTVFLGTERGLLKSEDAGKQWKPTALLATPIHRIEWPGPALVVASGRGVAISYDAGASFASAGPGLPEGPVRALALSSFFQVDPVLFAAAEQGGVFRSPDAGKTWLPAGLAERRILDLVWLGPMLYAAGEGGVFRSEDLGRSWRPLGQGLGGRVQRLLFPLAPDSGAVAFAASDQGVFRSDDGGVSWRASGLNGESVLSLATFPAPERSPARRRRN